MAALHAVDHAARHPSGEQRVLREIFKIAPAARVTNEVRGAAKKHIEALRSRFDGHRLALKPRNLWVPGRGESEIGRHRGRRVAGADVARICNPKLRVRLLQRGNTKARYAGHVACRANGSGWFRRPAPTRRDDAMEQRQLLLLGHLIKRHLRALGGGQGRIAPRPALRLRYRGEGQGHEDDHRPEDRQRRFTRSFGQIASSTTPFPPPLSLSRHRHDDVTRKEPSCKGAWPHGERDGMSDDAGRNAHAPVDGPSS